MCEEFRRWHLLFSLRCSRTNTLLKPWRHGWLLSTYTQLLSVCSGTSMLIDRWARASFGLAGFVCVCVCVCFQIFLGACSIQWDRVCVVSLSPFPLSLSRSPVRARIEPRREERPCDKGASFLFCSRNSSAHFLNHCGIGPMKSCLPGLPVAIPHLDPFAAARLLVQQDEDGGK